MRLVVILAAAATLLLLVLPGSSAADSPQLVGTVGPGFTISLKGADGSPVTHLDPGTYQLLVHDLSEEHDFHLFGPPGSPLDVTTGPDLTFVGDRTFTIVLQDGTKVDFVCDAHAVMHGSFTVGTVAATPPAAAAIHLRAIMNAAQEVPKQVVKAPAASGTFVGTLTGTKLAWSLSFRKLTGPATAAHIHLGRPGKAGPVAVPLCGPCTSGVKGTATLTAAQVKAVLGGGTYVNVHTAENPAGEIRGPLRKT
ncbi:MAG TPA: CHRD domain-containing protein [Gaiellaceae bacterium]|nr:CHRD domain-containing protein [Gaiellaceae bacterium]